MPPRTKTLTLQEITYRFRERVNSYPNMALAGRYFDVSASHISRLYRGERSLASAPDVLKRLGVRVVFVQEDR